MIFQSTNLEVKRSGISYDSIECDIVGTNVGCRYASEWFSLFEEDSQAAVRVP